MAHFSDYLDPGDILILNVDKENRNYGYNPGPDGTELVFKNYSTIAYGRTNACGKKPGIHQNRCWGEFEFLGKTETISFHHTKLKDDNLVNNRQEKYGPNPWKTRNSFLRDLPDLPFWEWDVITYRHFKTGVIQRIDYDCVSHKRNDGSPYPIYQISESPHAGWSMSFNENDISIIKRGNIWKWYNHEHIVFDSLNDEASLHKALGLYEEVRNPVSNLYSFSLEEALDAIRAGIADGFSVGNIPFSMRTNIDVVKFHDINLGKKVAKTTLEGFSGR